VWESRGSFVLPSLLLLSPSVLSLTFSFSLQKHRIFITVPVTNKLLIPCRVLDSHFYHLSGSALSLFSLSPPPVPLSSSHRTLLRRYLLPFSIRVSVLSHCCPTTTASSNVHPPFLSPGPALRPRPTRSTTATPPSRRHFLGFSLCSCSSLLLFCSCTKANVDCMFVQMCPTLDSSVREARSEEKLRVM